MKLRITIVLLFFINSVVGQQYSTNDGVVKFVSDAPLELIEASSKELQGILDLSRKTFAFKMYIKSFDGFNSPLQKVHFYENYMEVGEYPTATFSGKILEPITADNLNYRAKGVLQIHGVQVERIIPVSIQKEEEGIRFSSEFLVPLDDHEIELPRIVYQKIAQEINVFIQGELTIRK